MSIVVQLHMPPALTSAQNIACHQQTEYGAVHLELQIQLQPASRLINSMKGIHGLVEIRNEGTDGDKLADYD